MNDLLELIAGRDCMNSDDHLELNKIDPPHAFR